MFVFTELMHFLNTSETLTSKNMIFFNLKLILAKITAKNKDDCSDRVPCLRSCCLHFWHAARCYLLSANKIHSEEGRKYRSNL